MFPISEESISGLFRSKYSKANAVVRLLHSLLQRIDKGLASNFKFHIPLQVFSVVFRMNQIFFKLAYSLSLRRNVLRRVARPEPFELGELAIDYEERRVTVAGREVELTEMEFELLRVLNAGRVVTYDALLCKVWRGREAGDVNRVRNSSSSSARSTARTPRARPGYSTCAASGTAWRVRATDDIPVLRLSDAGPAHAPKPRRRHGPASLRPLWPFPRRRLRASPQRDAPAWHPRPCA